MMEWIAEVVVGEGPNDGFGGWPNRNPEVIRMVTTSG